MRKKYSTYKKIAETYIEKANKRILTVGIGSGRTSRNLLNACVETFSGRTDTVAYTGVSTETEIALHEHLVPSAPLQAIEHIDLYFDGADYIDPNGWIIKGYGGALFLEIVAMSMSSLCIIVVPFSKCVSSFANTYVPVEVVKPSLSFIKKHLEENKCTYKVRHSETDVYLTYLGNIIIDVMYQDDLITILDIPCVVAHGLIAPSKKIEIAIVEDPLY